MTDIGSHTTDGEEYISQEMISLSCVHSDKKLKADIKAIRKKVGA